MKMLFCIKHGTMEEARTAFETIKVVHEDGVEDERVKQSLFHECTDTQETEVPRAVFIVENTCNFPDGWATCPPPDFDMDAWMKIVERDAAGFDEFVHNAIREER